MMSMYIVSVAIILVILAIWVVVQHLARAFATRHPEFGPVREEYEGCGTSCRCSKVEQEMCKKQTDGEKLNKKVTEN